MSRCTWPSETRLRRQPRHIVCQPIYTMSLYTETGGLMSYGPILFKLWQDATRYFDKIFKGTKPQDIPIELPSTRELIINLKSDKALGLTIPQSLLLRADQIGQ